MNSSRERKRYEILNHRNILNRSYLRARFRSCGKLPSAPHSPPLCDLSTLLHTYRKFLVLTVLFPTKCETVAFQDNARLESPFSLSVVCRRYKKGNRLPFYRVKYQKVENFKHLIRVESSRNTSTKRNELQAGSIVVVATCFHDWHLPWWEKESTRESS